MEILDLRSQVERSVTRRTFIKGVIATGATVSSATYLFRSAGSAVAAQAPGSVERLITLRIRQESEALDQALQGQGFFNHEVGEGSGGGVAYARKVGSGSGVGAGQSLGCAKSGE